MTKQELADAFIAARLELADAHLKANEADKEWRTREAGKTRFGASLDALLTRRVADGTGAQECASEAINFAEAVAWFRRAEIAATLAKDQLDASTQSAHRALEALIAASPVPPG
jgi:hypothetical protein